MKFGTSALLLSIISVLVACGSRDDVLSSPDKGELVEPPIGGKADVASRVIDGGELGFGPDHAVTGQFNEDLQFFGWHVSVREGAVVTFDVTQKGSSRGLDTTLYVYGPKNASGFGSTALAFDDDEGWGTLSRIKGFSFEEEGEYLVVVGTYNGRGRGNFRLEATCLSGQCAPEVQPEPVETDCVFGNQYTDIWNQPGPVVIINERDLTKSDALSVLEEQQLLLAAEGFDHEMLTGAQQVFALADNGIVNQVQLWDASNRLAFTSYRVKVDNRSYGSIFNHGTVDVAAQIGEAGLSECNVVWGPEMGICFDDDECPGDMRCVGVYEVDQGRCIDVDKDDQSFEECSEDGLCSSGSGLVCAMGFLCNPGWMQGRFVGEPNLPIPDANFSGADATVLAYGLSTVSTDVSLDLHITHERPSDLIVSVLNPEGTEVIVFDRDDVAGEIRFKSLPVLGFPGDESANGNWTIRAIDTKTGSTGVIQSFALTIMSRWD